MCDLVCDCERRWSNRSPSVVQPESCAGEHQANQQKTPEHSSDTHPERPPLRPHFRLSSDTYADTSQTGEQRTLTRVTTPIEGNDMWRHLPRLSQFMWGQPPSAVKLHVETAAPGCPGRESGQPPPAV